MNKDKLLGISIMIAVLSGSIALALLLSYLIMSYPHEAMHISLVVILSIILFSLFSKMIMKNE